MSAKSPQAVVEETAARLVRANLAKTQEEAQRKVASALRRQDNINSTSR